MEISDRNTLMHKGSNNYFKGYWASMFIVWCFFKKSMIYEFYPFYFKISLWT